MLEDLDRGFALFRAGQLKEADRFFERVIAQSPKNAKAWLFRGLVAAKQEELLLAKRFLSACLSIDALNTDARIQLALLMVRDGDWENAYSAFKEIIQIKPDLAFAHVQMGEIQRAQANFVQALRHYEAALSIDESLPEAHFGTAEAHRSLGDLQRAVHSYESALKLAPGRLEIRVNLGNCLRVTGKTDEAVRCLRVAVDQQPDSPEAHFCLACAINDQRKLAEARRGYVQALELRPDFLPALMNLGIVFKDEARLDEALLCFRKALKLAPDDHQVHINLGNTYLALGQTNLALESYEQAIRLHPASFDGYLNLAQTLQQCGKLKKAIEAFEKAYYLNPNESGIAADLLHQYMHSCIWDPFDELVNQVLAAADEGSDRLTPFTLISIPTTSSDQFECNKRWSRRKFGSNQFDARLHKRAGDMRRDNRLRIGYLSADFRAHATTFLMREMLEQHDREKFEFFGYSIGPDDGSLERGQVQAAFDEFRDIRAFSHLDSYRQIVADQIDILVDLNGHTRHARTEILARRPAAIQVNYLGFPGTTGCDFYDYIIVDKFLVPSEQQPYFSENLIHLPCCYQANDSRTKISAEAPTRADCGLPEVGLVLCSFNNNYKITPSMFDSWMRFLKEIPSSCLWLLESNEHSAKNLRQEAESRGVSRERLVFASRLPLADHLARHRNADLFLDTFPCNAHTTASDALRTGLPLVTYSGETFASRVAGSLLHSLGMDELITFSQEEYECRVLELANHPERLSEVRCKLVASVESSDTFDGKKFCSHIENAYVAMWADHEAGSPPKPIDLC